MVSKHGIVNKCKNNSVPRWQGSSLQPVAAYASQPVVIPSVHTTELIRTRTLVVRNVSALSVRIVPSSVVLRVVLDKGNTTSVAEEPGKVPIYCIVV